jgi:RNase Y-like protein
MLTVVVALLALGAGVAGGFIGRKTIMAGRVTTAEARAAKVLADAEVEAQTKVRQALVEVKEEVSAFRKEAEEDVRRSDWPGVRNRRNPSRRSSSGRSSAWSGWRRRPRCSGTSLPVPSTSAVRSWSGWGGSPPRRPGMP